MNRLAKAAAVAVAVIVPASLVQAQSAGDLLKQVLAPQAPASTPATAPSGVTSSEANSGLKLALSNASELVVNQLGKPGGFANDPKVRIGLPGKLGKLNGLMTMLDKTGLTDGLTTKLNAAAEGAVGLALPLLKDSISKMTVTDALGIVTGGPTSATDYFKRTMGTNLQTQMRPVVSKSLTNVGAFNALNNFTTKNKLPVGQFSGTDLTGYVTQKASDGVFYYIGEQEKQIRANPLGTGSALLAKVFGKH
jgi:Protein of unknown function (DUF4197)